MAIFTTIMKVLDVDHRQLKPETVEFITSQYPDYTDNVIEEHLYGLEDLREQLTDDIPEAISSDINELAKIADVADAGYLRIIY